MFGDGVRWRAVSEWLHWEEERGGSTGISCGHYWKSGSTCRTWFTGVVVKSNINMLLLLFPIFKCCCCYINSGFYICMYFVFFLQYLHNEKKLLHGDMKSCNVVIKGDFESIKICDVGVSLPLGWKHAGYEKISYFSIIFPCFNHLVFFIFSYLYLIVLNDGPSVENHSINPMKSDVWNNNLKNLVCFLFV